MPQESVLKIKNPSEIPAAYPGTPIELLFRYQNFDEHLNTPENFAYMTRSAGANLMRDELQVSFAIGVGGISANALIGHTQCGMVDLASKKEAHFTENADAYEIGNETEFVVPETKRLRAMYPKVLVAPMMYGVETGLLYLLDEKL
jgi:carbonic anhydrase